MRLKEIRNGLGISQSQVARDLNITQATYNRYENGQRQIPNIILLSMADYFGVSADDILGRPGQVETKSRETEVMPKTKEAQIISVGIDKLPKEQREQALNVMKAVFSQYADYFVEKGSEVDDT